MLRYVLKSICFLFALNVASQADNAKLEWTDFTGSSANDYNYALCVDNQNNSFTSGWFEQTVDFAPGVSVSNLTAVGGRDVFIRKLDPNKNLIWVRSFGSTLEDRGSSITTDSAGNVISCGYFSGTTDFDPGPGTFIVPLIGSRDRFVHKMDANGNFLWAFSLKNSNSTPTQKVTVDSIGNIYLMCWITDTVDFDPGPGVFNLFGLNGASNGIIAKYDPNGNLLWAKSLEGTSSGISSISTDSQGNIFAGGSYNGTVDFDPGVGIVNSTASGSGDGFLLKLDSLGNFIWVKFLSGNFSSGINDIKITEGDTIFLIGTFRSTVDFDPNVGVFNVTSAQSSISYINVFITKWSPSGDLLWVKKLGSTSHEQAHAVTVDSYNNVYVSGLVYQATDFDPSPTNEFILKQTSTANADDLFIVVLNPDGDFVWVKRWAGNLTRLEIAMDNSDHLYVASGFGGSMDFDPGFITLTKTANFADMFLLKFTPCYASYGADTVQLCTTTPYVWINGITYFSNNNMGKAVRLNSTGCDSIVTLSLTFGSNSSGTNVVSACDQFTWINGVTYTSNNNSATHLLTNSLGCDSLVTLNLTINNSDYSNDIISSCAPITWIDGNTYTSSNNSATYLFTNNSGCDSLVTLNFTLNPATIGTDNQTVCDSLTWIDGITYTTNNNSATHLLTNSNGCDSLVTLNLVVNSNTSGIDFQTGCNSFTWIDGITYTSNNNSATHLLTNSNGCDSLVTLNLVMNSNTSGVDVQTGCNSFTWIDGNTYTTNNNSATFTLSNSQGCDSVVTLNLTFTPDVNVTQNGSTYTANANGAAYQWVECPNYNFIDSATNQTYTATSNGSYAVIIDDNGCIDTSACFVLNNVNLEEISFSSDIKVYPNPTSGDFTIDMGREYKTVKISILDVNGRLIRSETIYNPEQRVDLELDKVNGVYFLFLEIDGQTNVLKLVLQNG